MNFTILRYETIDSTNTEAAKQAKLGADEGLWVIARKQTAGRGRHGRAWLSDKDAGLYLSLVLRPRIDTRFLPLITLMSGVAIHDALKEFGLSPDIKWVNDILVRERKICGILAETVDTPGGLAVIVGIGVNLTSRNFPDEIAESATSIEAEIGSRVSADELAEVLTRFFGYFYAILSDENGAAKTVKHWSRRSSYFLGKEVRVTLGGNIVQGTTDGLEENGALRLRQADGSISVVQAGDVEKVRAED